MSDETKRRNGFAIVSMLVAVYVGGYFAISTKHTDDATGDSITREFPSTVIGNVYYPAGWAEAKLCRVRVHHVRTPTAAEKKADTNWWVITFYHGFHIRTFDP